MTDRELLEQALEALQLVVWTNNPPVNKAITALRERLAQPQRTHWEGCEEVHPECKKPGCAECGKSGGWALYCVACVERLAQPEQEPVACQYAKDVAMPEYRCAGKCQYAQPEQEPKCGAIIEVFGKDWRLDYMSLPVGKHKLYTQQYTYTAPQRREWVGLTEEERMDVLLALNWDKQLTHMDTAKSIEAKLKEKNA